MSEKDNLTDDLDLFSEAMDQKAEATEDEQAKKLINVVKDEIIAVEKFKQKAIKEIKDSVEQQTKTIIARSKLLEEKHNDLKKSISSQADMLISTKHELEKSYGRAVNTIQDRVISSNDKAITKLYRQVEQKEKVSFGFMAYALFNIFILFTSAHTLGSNSAVLGLISQLSLFIFSCGAIITLAFLGFFFSKMNRYKLKLEDIISLDDNTNYSDSILARLKRANIKPSQVLISLILNVGSLLMMTIFCIFH